MNDWSQYTYTRTRTGSDFNWGSVTDTLTVARTGNPTRLVGVPICPDLLRYENIGEADNLRGRVVRAFFWMMRAWPTS